MRKTHWRELIGDKLKKTSIFLILTLFLTQIYAARAATIVIDPGHGTKNSRGGEKKEAYYNLIMAEKIKTNLEKSHIFVALTHSSLGEDIGGKNPEHDNQLRAEIANKNKASLFLRIHFDSPNGSSAIYYPRLHPDREVAKKSEEAAFSIWSSLEPMLPSVRKGGVLGDEKTYIGSLQGGLLTGSKFSTVPVGCIEVLPLNTKAQLWLKEKNHLEITASAISQGILKYLNLKKSHKKSQDFPNPVPKRN